MRSNPNARAIIQARMGSSRLPGKALKRVGDHPLLEYVVRRTHRGIPNPVLAIPEGGKDDVIEDAARKWPCQVIRGSEEDVLSRFAKALSLVNSRNVVRVPGDNPLISPHLLSELTNQLSEEADWGHFVQLPWGAGAAIFRREWIEKANSRAQRERDREHVTLWVKRDSDARGEYWFPPQDYRGPELRLTVDTNEDLQLIRNIVKAFPNEEFGFSLPEVLSFLDEHPELLAINRNIQQRMTSQPKRMLCVLNRDGTWGSGHWSRFQRLRRGIKREDFDIQTHLVLGRSPQSNRIPTESPPTLKAPGDAFQYPLATENEAVRENTIQRWFRRTNAQIVYLDQKSTGSDLMKTLQNEGASVIGVEDRGDGRHRMDAVVDPNLYEDTLETDDVPDDRRYYGPKYAMIDPAYRGLQRQHAPENVAEVGLCFGGTDPGKIGPLFIREIAPRFGDIDFHLFGAKPEIDAPDNVTLDGFVEDAPKRFASMDFMVISGGVLKFEMTCLRMPSMILSQNEEQYENSRRFVEKNGLHWPVFPPGEDVAAWAEALFKATQPRALEASFRSTEGVVDGKGVQRVLKILTELIDT